jgi:DNA-binding Lrp family transcriptional regulator
VICLDDVDRKIISQLQLDGRTTLKELGKIVGYTSMGVKKRLKKLLEQGVIKVSASINLEPLELSAAIVLLEMESSEAMHKLLERFKECPRVVHIFTTLGGYNLIALVVAEDKDTLESISIEKCSLRSGEGIRRSEFYPIGNIYYSPFLPIREHLTHKERTMTPCNVDCRPCNRYKTQKCVRCPTTIYYRGTL